jgi:hypothetical protein
MHAGMSALSALRGPFSRRRATRNAAPFRVRSNNAFERTVNRSTAARGQRAIHLAPAARLSARWLAAQRER